MQISAHSGSFMSVIEPNPSVRNGTLTTVNSYHVLALGDSNATHSLGFKVTDKGFRVLRRVQRDRFERGALSDIGSVGVKFQPDVAGL